MSATPINLFLKSDPLTLTNELETHTLEQISDQFENINFASPRVSLFTPPKSLLFSSLSHTTNSISSQLLDSDKIMTNPDVETTITPNSSTNSNNQIYEFISELNVELGKRKDRQAKNNDEAQKLCEAIPVTKKRKVSNKV